MSGAAVVVVLAVAALLPGCSLPCAVCPPARQAYPGSFRPGPEDAAAEALGPPAEPPGRCWPEVGFGKGIDPLREQLLVCHYVPVEGALRCRPLPSGLLQTAAR